MNLAFRLIHVWSWSFWADCLAVVFSLVHELISTLAFHRKQFILLEILDFDHSGKLGDLNRVVFLNLGNIDILDQRINSLLWVTILGIIDCLAYPLSL